MPVVFHGAHYLEVHFLWAMPLKCNSYSYKLTFCMISDREDWDTKRSGSACIARMKRERRENFDCICPSGSGLSV